VKKVFSLPGTSWASFPPFPCFLSFPPYSLEVKNFIIWLNWTKVVNLDGVFFIYSVLIEFFPWFFDIHSVMGIRICTFRSCCEAVFVNTVLMCLCTSLPFLGSKLKDRQIFHWFCFHLNWKLISVLPLSTCLTFTLFAFQWCFIEIPFLFLTSLCKNRK